MQVHRAHERFEQAGTGLVLIGQASPRQAAAFRRKLGLDGLTVLADEERATYRAAGLKRANVAQLLGPQSALAGVKHGLRSGVLQGRVIGDAAQLGGAAVIAPGGAVLLHRDQRHAGDTIDPEDLLGAVAA